jgi:hypothetical protein
VQLLLYYGVLQHNFKLSNDRVNIRLLYSKYRPQDGLMVVAYYQKLFKEAIQYRNQLVAFEQTEVYMKTMSFTEARQEMQKGNVYGIFYIPSGFAVDATSGKQPRLSFYTNGTYLIAASLLFRDMKTMSVLAGAVRDGDVRRNRGRHRREDRLPGLPRNPPQRECPVLQD